MDDSLLTPRQIEVVELIRDGCSNTEIAERMGISPSTAKTHCDHIRQRLGVDRRRRIPSAYDAALANGGAPVR